MQFQRNLLQEPPTNTSRLFISFGHTADRLLTGEKTVTRRCWKEKYAAQFLKAYKNGQWIRALNKHFYAHGHQIGWLRFLKPLYLEPLSELTQRDCQLEGFPELIPQEFRDRFFRGLSDSQEVWVLEFEFRPCQPLSMKKYETRIIR